jgi:hypothetical protein
MADFGKRCCDGPTKLDSQSVGMTAKLTRDIPPCPPLLRQIEQAAAALVEPASDGVDKVSVLGLLAGRRLRADGLCDVIELSGPSAFLARLR